MGQALKLSEEEAARVGRAGAEDAGQRSLRQASILTQLFMVGTHGEIVWALGELGASEAMGVELLLVLLERRIPPEARGG